MRFGSIDVNRYVRRFKESLVSLSLLCADHPSFPSWWTKGWRACTSTCLAPIGALISSARPVRWINKSQVQEKKKKRKKLLLKIYGAQDHTHTHTHTPLHKQPHIVRTHLCLAARAKINISLSVCQIEDLKCEATAKRQIATASTCSQMHRLSPCDRSTSSTLLCGAPCASLQIVIAAHLCVNVSACLLFCYTTSRWLGAAHRQQYCVTL